MRKSQVKNAVKKASVKKGLSLKYCQSHCVEAIEYKGKIVCGFCRTVPEKIIHYHTETIGEDQRTVFYKECPNCGDIVRVVNKF